MSSVPDIAWQARVGFLTGMGVGGALAGKWCARSCEALIPKQVMIYGGANALAIYLFREVMKRNIGEEFATEVPWYWQMACIIPTATLATGAIANLLGVPLMVSTVFKIALGSAAGGILLGSIGWKLA